MRTFLTGLALGVALALAAGAAVHREPPAGQPRYQTAVAYDTEYGRLLVVRLETGTGQMEAFFQPATTIPSTRTTLLQTLQTP